MENRLVEPSWVNIKENGEPVLTEPQITSWREQGYALVQGLLPQTLTLAAQKEAMTVVDSLNKDDFGSEGKLEFPTCYPSCNAITLHSNLVHAASTLLNIDPSDLRLMQSDIWPKRGRKPGEYDADANTDQRMHCDYGNNTLVHPPGWYKPECVAMIVYLSSGDCGGGTAVSPRRGPDDPAYNYPIIAMPGYGGLNFINDKTKTEEYMKEHRPEFYEMRKGLYEREMKVNYDVGTVLLYRHDVWHRGTPVNENKLRIVMNLGFRRKECTWITTWNQGWARKMYYGFVEQVIADASLLQRSILGFPAVGDPYWTNETIKAVAARYSPYGFDPSPYYQHRQDAKK
eukprot:TRINITY_DN2120_c0_g1_i1.p1 TRINITY_DN2120_c0_g1~~TRINITY_DN2120_c0_g1_i1.p1  ORF type:complete len:343 (+),score=83.89 TRINITY_DN2120_c0_g1_i1:109-1137(+)